MFLPVQIAGDHAVTLLNKAQIARLLVRDGEAGHVVTKSHENLAARIETVVVTVVGGGQLSGWLAIQAPEWQSRLSDYLNHLPGQFSPCMRTTLRT